MDKETLRIAIIAIGVVIIIWMIAWHVIQNKRPRRDIDFYDDGDPLDNIDQSLVVDAENDDFDITPLGSALDNEPTNEHSTTPVEDEPTSEHNTASAEDELTSEHNTASAEDTSFVLPSIIQFSIVATEGTSFNGKQLMDAFESAGLHYNDMQVFERHDEQNQVCYTVASMVEPGTFSQQDSELHSFPGIVFFLQATELEQPLVVFDELIHTINQLTTQLAGFGVDHKRQSLTIETIQQFRSNLKHLSRSSVIPEQE